MALTPPATQPMTGCSVCGLLVPAGARFCPSCGAVLAGSEPPDAPHVITGNLVADPLIGTVIAERYRIEEMLGRGGMGVVYRCAHVHIGKLMAIKLLSGELASDAQTLKRFQREAKVISKLTHPNTVQIFDFGESAKLAYLVMEYLPGKNLGNLLTAQRMLPAARVAVIGAQIAASVEEAHASGVIHRDIKPENVMVVDTSEQRDLVKVLDFGIAKLRDPKDSLATQRGNLIGTPYYMAPEQIRGEAFDHRIDIYALGAVLYYAVTGTLPFSGATPMEILGAHLTSDLTPVRERAPELEIPEALEQIIGRAMEKDPARRFQSMAALRDELRGFLHTVGLTSGAFVRDPARMPLGRAKVATRGDIDGYEKEVVRASRLGWIAGGLGLLGVLYGGYALIRSDVASAPPGSEQEPNNEPLSANPLTPTQPIRAMLGKRASPSEGDADVYRIDLGREPTRVADIAVSALPNINLALDLVQKGSSQPILSVDSGGVGQPERIPNVTLMGDSYYVRVREVKAVGAFPIENVSDEYVISLALSAQDPRRERELDDSFAQANTLAVGLPLRGVIGWAKDQDVYCAAPSLTPQRVVLSGVPGLDLVLAYLDRRTEAGQRLNQHGPGEGERVELPASQVARESCFTVSAHEHAGKPSAAPAQAYEIALSQGE